MTACHWREDIGAYLLEALEDHEREAFETHAATCAECSAEIKLLRVASDALPNSPIQIVPPPELKGRIMAVVEREAALLRSASSDEIPAPRKTGRRVVAVLRPGWWSMRPGLALATSIFVLAIGAGGALLGSGALSGSGEQSTLASIGHARLIERSSGHSTLVADHLARPSAGHVYQVWLLHKGETSPRPTNALFSTRSDGTASVDVPGSLKNVDQVLVTEEPDGGSTTPTTQPVIQAHPA